MARYVPGTYKSHRARRVILTALATLLIAAVIFTVAMFFGIRRHIVYTSEGLRLEIPWLEPELHGTNTPQ
ncbi:MAG: hypothetical protein LBN30_03470 [Oscillospiraceae bacterium]|jgi:hypothetical protein|nr:hypothetical protein [Oscillospiraceae bacterium]